MHQKWRHRLSPRRAVLLAPLALAGCIAHFPRPDEPMAFMERTTAGHSPGVGQIFDAAPAIHVFFLNQLDDPEVQRLGGWAAVSSFSFLARIRMLDEPSTPVRTPSYEPRVRLQILRLSAPRPALGGLGRLLLGLDLAAAHYSNGQKGCALADQVRGAGVSDFDCTPLTNPPSTALNTIDGSFSTNYLEGGLRGRWMAFPSEGGHATWTATAGAAAQWHAPCELSGCIEPQMSARFGSVVAKWIAEADVVVVRGLQWRFPLIGTAVTDARLRGTAQGSVHFPSSRGPFGDVAVEAALVGRTGNALGVGPFVRYHRGRDDLNIRFEERLDAWTIGVVVDPAPSDRVER